MLPAPEDGGGEEVAERKRYANIDRRQASSNALSIIPYEDSNKFAPYIPQPTRELRPNVGRTAKEKMAEMIKRVQHKEAESNKRYRLRGKQRAPTKNDPMLESDGAGGGVTADRKICWVARRRVETANG